jgi:hypothetical protein
MNRAPLLRIAGKGGEDERMLTGTAVHDRGARTCYGRGRRLRGGSRQAKADLAQLPQVLDVRVSSASSRTHTPL